MEKLKGYALNLIYNDAPSEYYYNGILKDCLINESVYDYISTPLFSLFEYKRFYIFNIWDKANDIKISLMEIGYKTLIKEIEFEYMITSINVIE
ncbi:MAG: hypothetical protein HC877_18855 [Thioploca sp.]|nr:hypothetical protein [Thioploca sp.]